MEIGIAGSRDGGPYSPGRISSHRIKNVLEGRHPDNGHIRKGTLFRRGARGCCEIPGPVTLGDKQLGKGITLDSKRL